jgi:hypothetical protein
MTPMDGRFDTKIAIVLRDDLLSWQQLNVTAFLASGITAANPRLVGDPYVDADGATYLPLLGQPVLVLEGTAESVRASHQRALRRNLPVAVFTIDMFATGNDEDNRAVVRAVTGNNLELVGIAVHGARNAVDKVMKGNRMHP